MSELNPYQPEYNLLQDSYLGNRIQLKKKLNYLANLAQQETWDYRASTEKPILYNYLCYTYDRLKVENKISYKEDSMCFNTGLLTNHGMDIYAYFIKNNNPSKKENQDWFLYGFKTATAPELQEFESLPDIADYFTNPSDFIYDKSLGEPVIDYHHIIDTNFDRFRSIQLEDRHIINALLTNAVRKIVEQVKRNYKLAIPQYYTDKQNNISKIQLLLPLFLQNSNIADLALVVEKNNNRYVGKTVLPLEWAYINSRRIVKPSVEWLKIF